MTLGIRLIEFERTCCAGAFGRKNREVALKLATYRFCNFCLIIFFYSGMEWFVDNCYPPSFNRKNQCMWEIGWIYGNKIWTAAIYCSVFSLLWLPSKVLFVMEWAIQRHCGRPRSHEAIWNPTMISYVPRRWLSQTCVSKILFVKHIVSQLRWSTLLMAAITFRPLVCVMRLVCWAI